MTDLITFKADATALNQRLQLFAKAAGISLPQAVQLQFGLLCRDVVTGMSPKNLSKARKGAERDIKLVFRSGPPQIFPASQRGGGRGITWVYAGKKNGRFLFGVDNPDFRPDMTSATAARVLHDDARRKSPTKAWREIGRRGKNNPFHVMKLNRVLVKPGVFTSVTREVLNRFGLLKASFAVGWRQLKIRARLPSWVEKHVSSGRARGVLVNGLATPGKPHLKLISRATGCEKANSIKAIRSAVRRRIGAMKTDIRLYVQGIKKQSGLKSAQTLPTPNFNAAVFDAISE